jgi:hypothetical protein
MKFSASADVGLSAAALFAIIADIDAHERAALKRGAVLRRMANAPETAPGTGPADVPGSGSGSGSGSGPGPGLTWAGTVPLRGKRRPMTLRIETWKPPESVTVAGESPNFTFRFDLDLLALSRTQTRLRVGLEARPLTLTGRLLIQSARLGKGRLDRRFRARVEAFAAAAEAGAAAAGP